MKKVIVLTVVGLFLMVGVGFAGGVTDDNNGKKGDIFVSTGENHGASSVGEWVDSSSFKGEKGDNGDTGATGATGATGSQGIQGVKGNTGATGAKGDTGSQGIQGVAGINGTNGVKGDTGSQGIQGVKGDKGNTGAKGNKGDKGNNGLDGTNGVDGINGVDGVKGDKGDIGLTGDKGDAGKDVDPTTVTNLQATDTQLQNNINTESTARTNANTNLNNRVNDVDNRVSKLEDTQYNVVGKVRVYDSRKVQVNTFVSYSTTRSTVESAGVEITWKMGKSYEEKKNDELEARLNKLEGIKDAKEKESSTQLYTTANGMGIKNTF